MRHFLIAMVLLGFTTTLQAQGAGGGVVRVIVDQVEGLPLTPDHPLHENQVVAYVGQALKARGYKWERLQGAAFPPGAPIIRVLYIVNLYNRGKLAMSSASVQMLHTSSANLGQATLSLYDGVQQAAAANDGTAAGNASLREGFVKELNERIAQAIKSYEDQYLLR